MLVGEAVPDPGLKLESRVCRREGWNAESSERKMRSRLETRERVMRAEKYNLRRSTEDAAASGKGAIAAAGEENVVSRFRINEECLVFNLFLY
jgi:hypothetical protein